MKIGLIGFGRRGLTNNLKNIDGVEVTAGADINASLFASFKEYWGKGIFTTTDYREILKQKNIDAVIIATPDYCHEEQAVAALESGKSVFVEKPMAISTEGCDRVLDTARKNNKKIFVGHNMRYMSAVTKMKEIIDQGMIGEVKTCWCRHFIAYGGDAFFRDWHSEKRYVNGLLLQKGTHDIDVIHWLCGGYSKRVTAMGKLSVYDKVKRRKENEEIWGVSTVNHNNWPPLRQKGFSPIIDVEDLSMMLMELDNGVMASYQQCHYTPDSWRNYTVIGTEGRIENIGNVEMDCIVRLWNKRINSDVNRGDIEFKISSMEGGHGGADPLLMEEFVRFLRQGGKTKANAIAARNSVATGCAATISLRSKNTPQDVPSPHIDNIRYIRQL